MKILIFGNKDLEIDSLPIKLKPELEKKFKNTEFVAIDPNEDIECEGDIIIIDTVFGIQNVTVFNDLENFTREKLITMHDFGVLGNLVLLQKLNKVRQIKIIGIPPTISLSQALNETSEIIKTILL